MTLSKEQLLKATERRYRTVPLPTGGDVRVRSLTAGEMRTFRESFIDQKGNLIESRGKHMNELLVGLCLVDDSGKLLLTEADVLGACQDMDGAVLTGLVKACKEWTGFGMDGDWTAIENALRNFQSGDANSSAGASPNVSVFAA